jgi:glutamate-1-semialdehyde 2,1-aminomutase
LREKCTEHDILLIFDEVISGFRIGFEGAAGHYDIQPDLLTFGKIIGGGMPVGAFAGSREYMKHVAPEGPVYQAGTLSANPMAMAAGYATLQKLVSGDIYTELGHKTSHMANEIRSYIDQKGYEAGVQQLGSIFWIKFSKDQIRRSDQIDVSKMELFKKMHAYLLNESVYLGPSGYEVGFVSSQHQDEDLEKGIEKIKAAFDHIMR